MNDEQAKWIGAGFEMIVGVLKMLEQEHPKHWHLASVGVGTDRADKSYALSGTGGQALAIRLLGIHSPAASAGIRIPLL
jgi:hypothetical protein